MTTLILTMTSAGLGRFTAAQAQDDIDLTVAQVGFTASEFVPSPTLTALPGQVRRVATISGTPVGDNIIHMVVRDDEAIGYTVRGFGLFLADGTLFAVYGQSTPICEKSPLNALLMPIDIAFPTAAIDKLVFGNTNFLNPPATRERAGVVRFADQAELDAGAPNRAASAADLSARMPIGMISMWYGAAAAVPRGWAICDGQTVARSDGAGEIATPDLRDRVVVGAGTHEAGAAFGATEKTVQSANAGAHTPSGSMPRHAHGFTGSGTAANAPSGVILNKTTRGDTAQGGTGAGVATASLTDPGHGHAVEVSGTTNEAGPQALEMNAVPAHAHGVTIDVTQPSLSLHFIMRV